MNVSVSQSWNITGHRTGRGGFGSRATAPLRFALRLYRFALRLYRFALRLYRFALRLYRFALRLYRFALRLYRFALRLFCAADALRGESHVRKYFRDVRVIVAVPIPRP